MKPNRLLIASLLGFALLTTSAFASDRSNDTSGQSHWTALTWIYNLVADSHRQCDQYGQDTGRGNNCDRGRGNGGGYCGTGSSSSGGSTSGSGGSTSGSGSSGSGGIVYK